MNNSIRTFIPTKQLNTQAQPEQPKNNINVGFTSNTKFMPCRLRQRNFLSIHIQTSEYTDNTSN